MSSPASRLMGMSLPNNWKVVDKMVLTGSMTGSTFSYGYVVENQNGSIGFLKALDYSRALPSSDPPAFLKAMTEAFLFERQLLEKCRTYKMNRIVAAVDSGSITVDSSRQDGVVSYLIFERADGDINKQLDLMGKVDEAWLLRVMHHITTALNQLHTHNIAHQDVKPSNILVFKNEGSKLADLGCASDKNTPFLFDSFEIPGDREYAPPELLYQFVLPDWGMRRFSCDMYLLGSMLVFLFSRTNMTALLLSQLNDIHKPGSWSGGFEGVLVYLRTAFGAAIEIFGRDIPNNIKESIVETVKELCDPDPRQRGITKYKGYISQYSLNQYVSKFNLLASEAELLVARGLLK